MSGYLIAWKSIHQKQMALSSFEAEIVATNKCTKKLQSIRFHAQDTRPKNVWLLWMNNKKQWQSQVAVDWTAWCTNKGTKHINLRKNYVRELHQNGTTKVTHIPGLINASDLFTKELKDASHFRRCTALRSTPELASPSVKISFLIKGFRLLFPIRDPIEFSWR
jgi:hypothetical protein